MARSRILRHIVFCAYLLAITLVVLEVAVRFWGYSERHIYDPIYMRFEGTDEIPYIHKPGLANVRARGLAIINTDSLGLRSKTVGTRYGPKQPDEYRIAIVGDSVTFGEGVPNTDDTFARVVEDTLNQQQTAVKVRVFNYGASGYSVKQMTATLRYRMFNIDPDLVVMATIPADFDLARTPGTDRTGYLVDPLLARLAGLSSSARGAVRSLRLAYVFRDIVYSWISVPGVNVPLPPNELPASYVYVQQFDETARSRGVPSVVLLLPNRQTSFADVLLKQLNHDAVTFADFSSMLNEFTPRQFQATNFDRHPSPAVHRRIGRALADYILNTTLKTH